MYHAMFLVVLFALSGCATVTKGTTDTVLVQISNCAESISCEATNKKGAWQFVAPGPVTIKKSDQDLTLQCKDGPEQLTLRVTPTKSSMVWGNVLVGGIIGGGVDASTDAHWDIVDSLTLTRNYCYGQRVQPSQATIAHAVNVISPLTSLRAVDAEEKVNCKFIDAISKGAGGDGDVSIHSEQAMELALQQASQVGADSYYVVKADTTATGATVVIEALTCKS